MMRCISRAFVFSTCLFLTACGGGSDSAEPTPQTPPKTIPDTPEEPEKIEISGSVVKGPVANATVNLYMIERDKPELKGALLVSTETSADGSFSGLSVDGEDDAYLLEMVVKENSIDLNTGSAPIFPSMLSLVTQDDLNDLDNVNISPLTHIVSLAVIERNPAPVNVQSARSNLTSVLHSKLGLGAPDTFDIFSSPLVGDERIADPEVLLAHRTYNEAIAALFHYAAEGLDTDVASIASMIAKDILDGELDGKLNDTELSLQLIEVLDNASVAFLPIPGTDQDGNPQTDDPFTVELTLELMLSEQEMLGNEVDSGFSRSNLNVYVPRPFGNDFDGDGIPDNSDPDWNGDGIEDIFDDAPIDTDGDGIEDSEDAFPSDAGCFLEQDGKGADCWVSILGRMDSVETVTLEDQRIAHFARSESGSIVHVVVQHAENGNIEKVLTGVSLEKAVVTTQTYDIYGINADNLLIHFDPDGAQVLKSFEHVPFTLLALSESVFVSTYESGQLINKDGVGEANSDLSYLQVSSHAIDREHRLAYLVNEGGTIFKVSYNEDALTAEILTYSDIVSGVSTVLLSPDGTQFMLDNGAIYSTDTFAHVTSLHLSVIDGVWLADGTIILITSTEDGGRLLRFNSELSLIQESIAPDYQDIFAIENDVYITNLDSSQLLTQSLTLTLDSDGDGVNDAQDAFPTNSSASVDSDGDGFPDTLNTEFSDDPLVVDAFPMDSACWESSHGVNGKCDIAGRIQPFFPAKTFTDNASRLYLLDNDNALLHRWDIEQEAFLNPVILDKHSYVQTAFFVESKNAIYIGYGNGLIQQVDVGQPMPIPSAFGSLSGYLNNLHLVGDFLMAMGDDHSGSYYTTLDLDANVRDRISASYYYTDGIFNPADTNFYFYSDYGSISAIEVDQFNGLLLNERLIDNSATNNLQQLVLLSQNELLASNGYLFYTDSYAVDETGLPSFLHMVFSDNALIAVANNTPTLVNLYDGETLKQVGSVTTPDTIVALEQSGDNIVAVSYDYQQFFFEVISQADGDGDGIPQWWESQYGYSDTNAEDAGDDADNDGLSTYQEFVNATNPAQSDTDSDGVSDSQEVDLGSSPILSDTDGDGLNDGAEVENGTSLLETDTDTDGLNDYEEVMTFSSNPLLSDSDDDGMPDAYEALNGLAINTDDSMSDNDGDGLANITEYEQETDVHLPDTDFDNLSDGDEINTYSTNPLLQDTDGDRILDGDEVGLGLSPTLAGDAETDDDNDGFSNVQEYFAGTDIFDMADVPVATGLSDGSDEPSKRFNPIVISNDVTNLASERWSVVDVIGEKTVADTTRLFTLTNNLQVVAIDLITGTTLWTSAVDAEEYTTKDLYLLGDTLVVHSENKLHFYSADSGELLNEKLLGGYNVRATQSGDNQLITVNDESVRAYSAQNAIQWERNFDSQVYDFVVSGSRLVVQLYDDKLVTVDLSDGSILKERDTSGTDLRFAGILQSGSYPSHILNYLDGWLYRINIETLEVTAQNTVGYWDWFVSVEGLIYAFSSYGDIDVIRETDSNLAAETLLENVSVSSVDNFVLAKDKLLLSDNGFTKVFDRTTGSLEGEIDISGSLALLPTDLLLITKDGFTRAIEIGQDSDGDSANDWWESYYGLNPDDTTDGELDSDNDGLVNAEEFINRTNPTLSDTDSDGLSDSDEMTVSGTSPLKSDTDGDGLNDGAELNTYSTDPLMVDTDGDAFTDFTEVGNSSDPLDPDSTPAGIAPTYFSFEAGSFSDFIEPGDLIEQWEVSGSDAIDGNFSLKSAESLSDNETATIDKVVDLNAGSVQFEFKIDSESGFDYFEFLVNGSSRYVVSGNQSGTVKFSIEAGTTLLTWRYVKDNSVSDGADTVWIDNIHFIEQ